MFCTKSPLTHSPPRCKLYILHVQYTDKYFSFPCIECLQNKNTWRLHQEALSRSVLLYSFICFVMKANFWKLTLAVTSICFCHLPAMQIKPVNSQTGLSLGANILEAWFLLRIRWTSGTWGRGGVLFTALHLFPFAPLFSLNKHMLKESSDNLGQFMVGDVTALFICCWEDLLFL